MDREGLSGTGAKTRSGGGQVGEALSLDTPGLTSAALGPCSGGATATAAAPALHPKPLCAHPAGALPSLPRWALPSILRPKSPSLWPCLPSLEISLALASPPCARSIPLIVPPRPLPASRRSGRSRCGRPWSGSYPTSGTAPAWSWWAPHSRTSASSGGAPEGHCWVNVSLAGGIGWGRQERQFRVVSGAARTLPPCRPPGSRPAETTKAGPGRQ